MTKKNKLYLIPVLLGVIILIILSFLFIRYKKERAFNEDTKVYLLTEYPEILDIKIKKQKGADEKERAAIIIKIPLNFSKEDRESVRHYLLERYESNVFIYFE